MHTLSGTVGATSEAFGGKKSVTVFCLYTMLNVLSSVLTTKPQVHSDKQRKRKSIRGLSVGLLGCKATINTPSSASLLLAAEEQKNFFGNRAGCEMSSKCFHCAVLVTALNIQTWMDLNRETSCAWSNEEEKKHFMDFFLWWDKRQIYAMVWFKSAFLMWYVI